MKIFIIGLICFTVYAVGLLMAASLLLAKDSASFVWGYIATLATMVGGAFIALKGLVSWSHEQWKKH